MTVKEALKKYKGLDGIVEALNAAIDQLNELKVKIKELKEIVSITV